MGKKVGKLKKTKGAYTLEQKIETVRVLKENNYNYNLTATQLGVSPQAVRSWDKEYGREIETSTSVQLIAETVELNMARAKSNFINKHYDAMNKLTGIAIDRAIELMESEDDLNKVTNTIKTISDFMSKLSGEDQEENKKGNTYNLIQQAIFEANKEM